MSELGRIYKETARLETDHWVSDEFAPIVFSDEAHDRRIYTAQEEKKERKMEPAGSKRDE
jgi:hypothetical protein